MQSIFSVGDRDRTPTFEDLQQMEYLERVVKETLRMFPPLPAFGRNLTEEMEIGGRLCPAGNISRSSAIIQIPRIPFTIILFFFSPLSRLTPRLLFTVCPIHRFDVTGVPAVRAIGRPVLRGPGQVRPGQFPAGRVPGPTSVRFRAVQRGLQELHRHQVRHAPDEDRRVHFGPAQPVATVGQVSRAQAPQAHVPVHLEIRRRLPRENHTEDRVKRRAEPSPSPGATEGRELRRVRIRTPSVPYQ